MSTPDITTESASTEATSRLTTPALTESLSKHTYVFSGVDTFVFSASVISVAVTGVMLICSTSKTFRGYFLASGNLGIISMTCSFIMSNIGSTEFLGLAQEASHSGLGVYAYELNTTVILILLGWVFLPVYIASGSLTTVEYIRKRFGGRRLELTISVLSLFLIVSTKVGVELVSITRLVTTLYPNLYPWLVTVAVLIVSSSIPFSGGLSTMANMNILLGVYFAIGTALIAYFCLSQFEDYNTLKSAFFEAWPNTTKAYFGSNSSYRYTTCGVPKATSWNLIRPYYDKDFPWPGMFLGISILNTWYWCCDQVILQIGLGGTNMVKIKYACIICGYIKLFFGIFMVVPGLVVRTLYTDAVGCADPSVCNEVCGQRVGCSSLAFPSLFAEVLKPNYRGLVLAAVLACCISSVSANLNSGSNIFVVNIYPNLRAKVNQLEMLVVKKMAVLVLALASLLYGATLLQETASVFIFRQSLTTAVSSPVVAVFLCGLFWNRTNEKSAFIGLLLGLGVSFIRAVWSSWYPPPICGEEGLTLMPAIISHFHFLHFAIFVFCLSVSYLVLTGIFSEPINTIHLYRLVYWLRNSKMERVDIDDAQVVLDKLLEGKIKKIKEVTLGESASDSGSRWVDRTMANHTEASKVCCCIEPHLAQSHMMKLEMRELAKQRSNIEELTRHAKTLNLHAILLLLISSVLWGYFS